MSAESTRPHFICIFMYIICSSHRVTTLRNARRGGEGARANVERAARTRTAGRGA